jgi:hypothetical protein
MGREKSELPPALLKNEAGGCFAFGGCALELPACGPEIGHSSWTIQSRSGYVAPKADSTTCRMMPKEWDCAAKDLETCNSSQVCKVGNIDVPDSV